MKNLKEIEEAIRRLSRAEISTLRNWLNEFDNASLAQFLTDDGLINTNHLEIIRSPYDLLLNRCGFIFRLLFSKDTPLLLYPEPCITEVLDYLFPNTHLWSQAAIRVLQRDSSMKGAPIYGPNFRRAIEIALKERFVKSKFQVSKPEHFRGKGLLADILVHLGRTKEENGESFLELQAWETLDASEEVFYIHARMTEAADLFVHLDGAIIYFTSESKRQLFAKGKKIKGSSYEKQFRLDGRIAPNEAFEIINAYLPIDELSSEYFELGESEKGILPTY